MIEIIIYGFGALLFVYVLLPLLGTLIVLFFNILFYLCAAFVYTVIFMCKSLLFVFSGVVLLYYWVAEKFNEFEWDEEDESE